MAEWVGGEGGVNRRINSYFLFRESLFSPTNAVYCLVRLSFIWMRQLWKIKVSPSCFHIVTVHGAACRQPAINAGALMHATTKTGMSPVLLEEHVLTFKHIDPSAQTSNALNI